MDIVAFSHWIRQGVLWGLWGLSVISLGIILERIWFFVRHKRKTRGAQQFLNKSSSGKDCLENLSSLPEGWEKQWISEGITSPPSAAYSMLWSSWLLEKLRWEWGLGFLGTLGSNAPFLGLLGTVLGITDALKKLSLDPQGGIGLVMGDLGEALLATAAGLFVAIPAVVAYNFFQRNLKQQSQKIEALIHRVLFLKEGSHGSTK